ncbi:uncharacterized protein LOC117173360 [Belonocnema kinseyi]|uniref:uncharacterized protein LOC117173360 n=1 Tax=Belonocnema kinseyi TaxID=2817044 RepID=UPI00143D91A3|nr:uncharacterized protein LOC117173360 [Belonocnema kinseyi]
MSTVKMSYDYIDRVSPLKEHSTNFTSVESKIPISKRSFDSGIDSSHIPPISQLMNVFSPSKREKRLRTVFGEITNIKISGDSSSSISSGSTEESATMPSTSGIRKKRFPDEKIKNSSQKRTIWIGDTSSKKSPKQSPTLIKIQDWEGKKYPSWKTSYNSNNSRRSSDSGIDSSHTIRVSQQLLKLYSTTRRARGPPRERALNVPQIEITKSASINLNINQFPKMDLLCERFPRSKSEERNSPMKPWSC